MLLKRGDQLNHLSCVNLALCSRSQCEFTPDWTHALGPVRLEMNSIGPDDMATIASALTANEDLLSLSYAVAFHNSGWQAPC